MNSQAEQKNVAAHSHTGARAESTVADIALLLEGTYPFVRGGVSSWVHQIISGLPEFRFAVIFVGGEPSLYGKAQYTFPANVTHFETHYLLDNSKHTPKACKGDPAAFADMAVLHEQMRLAAAGAGHVVADQVVAGPSAACPSGAHSSASPVNAGLSMTEMLQAFTRLGGDGGISKADFLFSEASYDYVSEQYRQRCTEPSFVDYFWAVRTMHTPLFVLADIARKLPPVRMVHSISTGYAGLLGAMIRLQRTIPFALTEHGIYTKERKIDLAQATWIRDHNDDVSNTLHDEMGYIRGLWIKFFEQIGRIAYSQATPIVSLYEGNRQRQIADGAEAVRTQVITNGINLQRYATALAKRPDGIPPVLGLIGRIVPIKDIKTFVRMMRVVVNARPDAEGWLIGPEDEDPAYVQECKDLVESLGLQANVKFLGFQNVAEILPQLGLMMLTSISEALPLVLLEAFASGVPSVATDVGSCRELIEGSTPEDRTLGSAGAVVAIADPESTAQAALALLNDPARWLAAQQAGLKRVEKYYDDRMMFGAYRELYQQTLAGTPSDASNAGER